MQKIAVSTNQMIGTLVNEGKDTPKEPSGAALLWTHEQVALVAESIYDRSVRSTIETAENLGQFLTLEVETGNYCLASNMVDSILPLKQQYPLGRLFTLRVGYPTAASFGGLDDPIAVL
jgi:hypothetical protein